MTGQEARHISIILGEKILELLVQSGASETERHAALDVARAIVPVLPNASCSIEKAEIEGGGR